MFMRVAVVVGIILLVLVPLAAQENEPVVYGVLFYSPNCGHCANLIQNDLPAIQEQFGDQFQLLAVNAATRGGSYLMQTTCTQLDLLDRCGGVPAMLIGETLLVGGHEIPAYAPGIIQNGLAIGGIDLPDVPVLRETFEAAIQSSQPESQTESTQAAEVEAIEEPSLRERLAEDPVANALAIAVLAGLIIGLVFVPLLGARGWLENMQFIKPIVFFTTGAGLLIARSLVVQESGDTLAMVISWGVLGLLAVVAVLLVMSRWSDWAVPLAALAGLAVAVYLAHVELTETEAICGAVGNCNVVQQSTYARLFGLIPIGVLGVVSYVVVLVLWGISRARDSQIASVSLLAFVLFGVLFSAYLTFLEPFVIGATCAWCLTSAVTMLLLLWLVAPAGWEALRDFLFETPSSEMRLHGHF